MNFYQLAFRNVTRNIRSYLAFYFSSSFAVMTFYMFAMFIFHPALDRGYINNIAKKGMIAAEWIIFAFSILFVLYSFGAFLYMRKKELGVLTILGTSPRQMRHLLTVESLIIGLASIITGIVGGTILAKLFFVAGSYIIDMDSLTLYLPLKALGLTIGIFTLLFFIISQCTFFFIHRKATVSLLKESKKPKKEPKASIILSFIGLVVLFTGYSMALVSDINMTTAVIILITTVIGTYFLFSQLSVWLLKLMKKNKRFYWRGYNVLLLSDLTYRVRDNARLFFIVTIVSAVAFTATGVLSVFKSNLTTMSTKFEIEYLSFSDNDKEKTHINYVKEKLKENNYHYTLDHIETIRVNYQKEDGLTPPLLIFSINELKTLFPELKKEELKNDQGIYFMNALEVKGKKDIPSSLNLTDQLQNIEVKKIEDPILFVNQAIVVNENTYEKLKKDHETSTLYGFSYKNWKESVGLTQKIKKELFGDYSNIAFNLSTKASVYYTSVQLPSLSLFIGLFIAIVFFFAAGSFLYFRLFTDLNDERKKYRALSKIGLTEREMTKNVTWQLGTLFFLPFIFATIHTGFALKVLERDGTSNVFVPSMITIMGFFILQIIYFTVIRFSYLKKLKEGVFK
ncbi:ABC transporter permease [Cytobacillus sp. IB215665]|uniref:ABC transporter permease n=1 Tax=Cytobacillus sp. IB215665 TaxID=3097357 RepID=UPI002A15FDDB|nr:ABC transporter permease [Cytobacillus sp. IB215665]MDX8367218.1 ABC transporter permease [Cytobacillus sp. IB215665]